MNISDVIQRAYASEINVGLQTFWDAGLDVWIGDTVNEKRATANFRPDELDAAAAWIDEQIRLVYPESDYSKTR